MDVLAGSDDELQTIVAGIEANPQAAAVLVQVLRSTEGMAVIQALTVESLAYATLQSGAEFAGWLAARRQQKHARVLAGGDDLLLLERQDSALRLVLNSPASRNSLSAAMRDALSQAFRLVAMEPGIESVNVTGIGPSFCAVVIWRSSACWRIRPRRTVSACCECRPATWLRRPAAIIFTYMAPVSVRALSCRHSRQI